jgi:hypothetical protein
MSARAALLILGALVPAAGLISAQTPTRGGVAGLPRTEAAIGEWDAAIVRRAATMIGSPSQWNRSDSSPCTPEAKAVSLRCAFQRSIAAATGRSATRDSASVGSGAAQPSDCRLTNVEGRDEGSCGLFFDEATVFSISRAKAITTGRWRADVAPAEVWAGRMINAGGPVLQQARRLVDVIAPGKYKNARLAEFNDDSTVTFAKLQEYFRTLEDRVRKLTPDDLASAADDVEIELYAGGAGVIRTYNGWYAVSGFSSKNSTIHFQVDTAKQIAPNALDREIVKRADALLSSDAVWNRADNRQCDAAARTWSIYCALEHATREVTGGFHHRRPALEIVRVIVEERTKDRNYSHRLMDYNNDASTHLDDVRTLFAAALARMK